MKQVINYISFACMLALCACDRQTTSKKDPSIIRTEIHNGIATSEFKVWGNCDMCKETIEGSLQVAGVSQANWNKDEKMISVSYDTLKISLDQIQKQIASVGYDNIAYKGDDNAYGNLPGCCQYDRK